MERDLNLIARIMKQLEEISPDSARWIGDILPDHKDREEVWNHLIYMRDIDTITLREGKGARGVKPLLFDIRLKK